jgi:hypothetical protein
MTNNRLHGFMAAMATAVALTTIGLASGANAAPVTSTVVPLSSTDLAHFREVWNRYSVPSQQQTALIAKFRSGGTWDSLTNAAPVSISTQTGGGVQETISRFPDGSIKVVQQETMPVPGQITPMADIYGCQVLSSGPGYINRSCAVHTNVVVADFGYGVTFKQAQNNYDSIISKSALTFNCYGGTCNSPTVKILRTKETATLPASVEGGLVFNCYNGTCSRKYFLVFELRKDKYTAWNN